jgi:hypothetical protein
VLVNPTGATQTVDLGESMTNMAGQAVTSVTLTSGTAEILTKTAGGNLPPEDVRNLRRADTR